MDAGYKPAGWRDDRPSGIGSNLTSAGRLANRRSRRHPSTPVIGVVAWALTAGTRRRRGRMPCQGRHPWTTRTQRGATSFFLKHSHCATRCRGMYLRRNFSSSGLVCLLDDLDPAGQGHPAPTASDLAGHDTAEKLSRWVGVFEAGALHAALQQAGSAQAGAPGRPSARLAVPLRDQLLQVRSILSRAITSADAPGPAVGRARHRLDPPSPAMPPEADFAPYRQRYQDVQRNMDLMIAPLRDNVRQTLSAASPGLRQLAALDAAWEQMLAGREQKLLAAVPLRLKRRFEQLRLAHQQGGNTDAAPGGGPQPDAWLDLFRQDLRQVLAAELDVRLEPVTGLIEAFEQEGQEHP
ncbi:MAG: DUF3348 family protein [Comamonadaceae bacterium]|nr:MAG: DUF3348 family protein [Comamonadaceae bacterium]